MVTFGVLDGWQFNISSEIDLHMPQISHAPSRDESAGLHISSERVLVKQNGDQLQAVTSEDDHGGALDLSVHYATDFGGCKAPVLDGEVTLGALAIRVPVVSDSRYKDVKTKIDATVNFDLRTWNPADGTWKQFAALEGDRSPWP